MFCLTCVCVTQLVGCCIGKVYNWEYHRFIFYESTHGFLVALWAKDQGCSWLLGEEVKKPVGGCWRNAGDPAVQQRLPRYEKQPGNRVAACFCQILCFPLAAEWTTEPKGWTHRCRTSTKHCRSRSFIPGWLPWIWMLDLKKQGPPVFATHYRVTTTAKATATTTTTTATTTARTRRARATTTTTAATTATTTRTTILTKRTTGTRRARRARRGARRRARTRQGQEQEQEEEQQEKEEKNNNNDSNDHNNDDDNGNDDNNNTSNNNNNNNNNNKNKN